MSKWIKIEEKGLPKTTEEVRNQTGELIYRKSKPCVAYGEVEDAGCLDFYVRWDPLFKERNPEANLVDNWGHAKFFVTHWHYETTPRVKKKK